MYTKRHHEKICSKLKNRDKKETSWRTSALGLFVGLLEGTTEGSGVGNAVVGLAVCLRVGCVITAMNHKEERIMRENWFVCSVSLVLC